MIGFKVQIVANGFVVTKEVSDVFNSSNMTAARQDVYVAKGPIELAQICREMGEEMQSARDGKESCNK